jgi:hypothetical protein
MLHAGASKKDFSPLSPKVVRITTELEGLDYAGLLVVQGLVDELARAALRRFARSLETGGNGEPELDAFLAKVARNTAKEMERDLATPRIAAPFEVRDSRDLLTNEPPISSALTRGHADLNGILNSGEFVTLSQAAKVCGTSEQTIRTRVKDRKLFGVAGPGGVRSKYPIWQFSRAWGQGVLEKLLKAMPGKSGLETYQFFTAPNLQLAKTGAGKKKGALPSPLDLLAIKRDGSAQSSAKPLGDPVVQRILRFAEAFAAESPEAA